MGQGPEFYLHISGMAGFGKSLTVFLPAAAEKVTDGGKPLDGGVKADMLP